MKKTASALVLSLILLGTGSCADTEEDGKLKIATTFAPVYDFAKRIAGDKADIITIVGDNEPHDFSPNSARTVAFCEKADLLLAYGHGMDLYAKSLNGEKYREITEGVSFMETGGEEDPHAYLGIKQAETMLKDTYGFVSEADPGNGAYYKANYERAVSEFEEALAEGKELLKDDEGKSVVTSHEAFAYFVKDYGLTQFGVSDIADHEVSAPRLNEVITYIKTNSIRTVFVEELDSPGYVEQVQNELLKENYEIELKELSAYESVSEEEYPDGRDYLSVYRENLKELAECLK